ncbi:MAG: GGDEF domain-containing protein, partial [Phaeospirillum sp.]|nr:GGDEF domain-containing protein [Phaeospirillum sp.]
DTLTGLANRKTFDFDLTRLLTAISSELQRPAKLKDAERRNGAVDDNWLVIIDIDHFKRVNDRHGHDMGDEVLCLFVSVVTKCLRQVDVFGRMGGEEFAVLMPETAQKGALIAAERIREAVEQAKLDRNGQSLSVTVSVGAVVGTHTVDEALNLADEALYRAKHDGRNRVVLTEAEGDSI